MAISYPSFENKNSLPICQSIAVRWGDMDAFGHVNNTVFFRFFEIARIAYFEKMNILNQSIGPILASTSCRFLAPIIFPDEIFATAHVYETYEFGFGMGYALYSAKDQRIMAKGEGRIVSYDYQNHKKVILPNYWREQIHRLENKPFER